MDAERVKILASMGRVDEARRVLAQARERWGDSPPLMEVWQRLGGR